MSGSPKSAAPSLRRDGRASFPSRANTRRRALGLAVALLLTSAVGIASAAAVVPPAGTPDVSAMAVQPTDLAPGAVVGRDGYQTPPAGFTADYRRVFTTASLTTNGTQFMLDNQVLLAPTSSLAQFYLSLDRIVYGSKKGRLTLARAIVHDAGKRGGITVRDVHFSKLKPIAAGSGSFMETVTVHGRHSTASVDLVVIGAGQVAAQLVLSAGQPLPGQVPTTLAGDIVCHVTTVLGATGPTGATGATATGTTGATGA